MRRYWEDKQWRCYLRRKTIKVTDRFGTLSYRLLCDNLWRISDTQINCLFHCIFILPATAPNRHYHNYDTFNISVVCIGLFISLHGAYQALFCLLIACYLSGVRQRWHLTHSRFFWSKMWGYLGGSVGHWSSYGLKQGNPLKVLKITHNYLIFIFYCHFFTFSSFHGT